jgi:hypothetical protein
MLWSDPTDFIREDLQRIESTVNGTRRHYAGLILVIACERTGLAAANAMMRSSIPKVPLAPFSFDITRKQKIRTARELDVTPTIMTVFVLSRGTTPQASLTYFSMAAKTASQSAEFESGTYSRTLELCRWKPHRPRYWLQALHCSKYMSYW